MNIGDAILRFFADTSDLDQAFARIPAQTEAAMGAAAQKVGTLGNAFQGVNFELDATAENVPFCGEIIKDSMGKATESTHEARGEAALLGELFGIHLPRHVRSFIAELPGVGAALSAAFAATAVIFLIEAVVQIVEKIKAFTEETNKIKEAMTSWDEAQRKTFNNLEDGLLRAQEHAADLSGNHLEALRLKLELIDHQNLDALDGEMRKLGDEAQKVLALLDRNWFSKTFLGLKGADEAEKKFKDIQEEVSKAFETRTPEAYDAALKKLAAALDDIVSKQEKLAETPIKTLAIPNVPTLSIGPDPKEEAAWADLSHFIQQQMKDITEAQKKNVKERENASGEETKKEQAREQQLANARFKVYQDIAKAHAQLQKELEQQADAESKKVNLRAQQQLKDEAEKNKEILQQDQQRIQGEIALVDGELQKSQAQYEKRSLELKIFYDRGLLSRQQYLAQLKVLGDNELANERRILEQKQQLVILEAMNEAARRGQILSAEQAKELKGYIDLENKKAALKDQFDLRFAKSEEQITKKMAKDFATIDKLLDDFGKKLRDRERDLQGFARVADAALADVSKAFGNAIEQWISGQESFGAALKKALQQYLAQVAGKAAIDALYFTAWGIADSFWNPARAGADFAAAGEFAAIAAVAGGAAAAMGKGGSSAGGRGGSGGITQDASTQAGGVATSTANVPHLAGGAIVTRPTLAVVGDAPGGGSRPEAILPLDHTTLSHLAAGIVGQMKGPGGGGIQNNFQVKGMISTQDLARFGRVVTRAARTGRVRMAVSDASRVTRRS